MQFQIPQFIETEDKIVGPLTLRQFIYLGVAGFVIVILYYAVQAWLFFILTALVGGLTLSLAFLKINGRPFHVVALSAFSFYWNPQTYVWRPETPRVSKKEVLGKEGSLLEDIVAGAVLKDTWRGLQSGSRSLPKEMKERYEIYQRLSGDRQAARRIDFR